MRRFETKFTHMPAERLQKIIAAAGIASRRKAEELISAGHVKVNGTVVTELGSKADPETDHIRVDGKLLQGAQQHIYLLLNKPKGYVTTVSDPEKRPTVMQLIRGVKKRVYPVGRLDYASEGLLLLTNDGALANKLMKAASQLPKTYVVKVAGAPSNEALEKLRGGVSIATEDGRRVRTAPAMRITALGSGLLVLLVAALGGYILYKFIARKRFMRELRISRITVEELKEKMDVGEQVMVVDLRHPLDFDADPETIPGAFRIDAQELEQKNDRLPRDREVILYCTCPNEATSARLALLLRRHGVKHIRPLQGGLDAWRDQGYPVASVTHS